MKILTTIQNEAVAPRFDLTPEIVITEIEGGEVFREPRIILVPGISGEDICGLAIKENVALVICGGIEDAHYQYLKWKKIKVIDRIIGPYAEALQLLIGDKLKPGRILPGAVAGDRQP